MKIHDRLNQISPILCRMLARQPHGRPLTTFEISNKSGIPAHFVEVYSWSQRWDDIPMGNAFAFARACGVDLFSYSSCNRVCTYLKNDPSFKYLRKHPDWLNYYMPMMRSWHASFNGIDRSSEEIWTPIRKLLKRLDVALKKGHT